MKKFLVEIPEDLHKDFKVSCAKNGDSMNEAFIELMKYYVVTTNEPLKLKENE